MTADTRAFQETFRYKCSSVHCSCLELKFCAVVADKFAGKHFEKKKKKRHQSRKALRTN